MSDQSQISNIVAFCVLMENGGGIMGKSPDYILEKYRRYCQSSNPTEFMWGLDSTNTELVAEWHKAWHQQQAYEAEHTEGELPSN